MARTIISALQNTEHKPTLAIQSTEPQAQKTRSLSSAHLWLLTAGGFFAFFVFGFVDNLKGPTLPALLRDLNSVPYTHLTLPTSDLV